MLRVQQDHCPVHKPVDGCDIVLFGKAMGTLAELLFCLLTPELVPVSQAAGNTTPE